MEARNAKSSAELSEEELRLLGEAIDDLRSPLTLYDRDFRVIYANESSRRTWPELHAAFASGQGLEAAAKDAAKALFPDAPEETIARASAYVVAQFQGSEPHDMMAPDGRWMKVSHHRMHDGVIAGVAVDITHLKTREKELERAHKAQEDLMEVLDHGVLVISEAGLITSFNSKFREYCRVFGTEIYKNMPAKEMFWQLVHNSEYDVGSEDFDSWFEGFFKTRFNIEGKFEQPFSLSDGRHILCHQQYRCHVGNVITVTDVTEIKAAQLKAEAAERSKSEFLANMSHEIRTPMNGVIGMAYLLSRSNLGEDEKNLVELIKRSGTALITVINDILDFSKIEAGQISLVEAEFDIKECLDDIVALLGVAASEKNIELTVQYAQGLPLNYVGDAGRFRQIMTNILGNAVKFTEKGSVRVSVFLTDEGHLSLSVRDTGIGISQDKLALVFDKFQQADSGIARKYEGTGLGLSIALRLANLMGGDIKASSIEGEGSHFEIILPLRPVRSTVASVNVPMAKAG